MYPETNLNITAPFVKLVKVVEGDVIVKSKGLDVCWIVPEGVTVKEIAPTLPVVVNLWFFKSQYNKFIGYAASTSYIEAINLKFRGLELEEGFFINGTVNVNV